MFRDIMPTDLKRIAIILEGRVQYERNVLRGIRDFAATRDGWLLRLERPGAKTAEFIENWLPDGVLFQSSGLQPAVVKKLWETGNSIHLSESPPRLETNSVGLDNGEIGRTAAAYYLERRFEHFAFVGTKDVGFSQTRQTAFQTTVKAEGHKTHVLQLAPDMSETHVLQWLRNLPKPCGLFATHDECSLFLTTICRNASIRIPEEIAILGVDDDTLICELAWPQLSSVAVPSRRVGFTAAQQLSHMMAGNHNALGRETLLLPPTGVITRHSTDVHQTEDVDVNRALRFMHSHVSHRINVEDVLRKIGVSRRLLERKFAHHVGRSPLQEIQRLRFSEAKRLLLETRLPLHQIANRCGCSDASRLVTMFRRESGMTPGQFRKAKTAAARCEREKLG